MVLLHAAEMAALLTAVIVTGGLARSHPGRGMGLAMLVLLVATVLVGWQGRRLLAGPRSLNVTGLAVQSGIVMVAIAFTTQNPAVGGGGVVVACSVLAGWGRLAKASSASTAPVDADPSPQSVHVAVNGPGTQVGVSGAVLASLTAVVVVAALSVRSNILFGLAILAVIFIPWSGFSLCTPAECCARGGVPTWCTIWSTAPR
jgi:hypothetical protein